MYIVQENIDTYGTCMSVNKHTVYRYTLDTVCTVSVSEPVHIEK